MIDVLEYIIPNDLHGFVFFLFNMSIGILIYYSFIIKIHTFYGKYKLHIIFSFLFGLFFCYLEGKYLCNLFLKIDGNSNKLYIYIMFSLFIMPVIYSIYDKKFKIKYKFMLLSLSAILLLGFIYHLIFVGVFFNNRVELQKKIYIELVDKYTNKELLVFCDNNKIKCVNQDNINNIESIIFTDSFIENAIVGDFEKIKINMEEKYINSISKTFLSQKLYMFYWNPENNKYAVMLDDNLGGINRIYFIHYFSSLLTIILFWFWGLYSLLLFHSKKLKGWKKYESEI